ncbi:kinesin-like protein KIF20B [Fundulus heteroclitus]|uniref:kinesin-like protein KIF20B n=1 Tax=Fundulus heteroclitus TaxID=8078 RepID=UPI00165B898F|nr:kinesin-like protein KIF20B [Fundulus heteroclitus]
MSDSVLNYQADQRRVAEDGNSGPSSASGSLPEPQPSSREDREHLQVYLRVRPFTSAERSAGESQDCVTIEPPDSVLLKPPSLSLLARLSSDKSLPQAGRRFQFSKVYGPETTQAELFDGAVRDLVQDVLGGGNSLVFTYGVTNSGKTFTFLGPDSDGGVVPRSLRLIFSSLQERLLQGASVRPQRCREFTVLTRQQQAEEALVKKNLLRESENGSSSLLNMTHQTLFEGTATADRVNLEVPPNTKFSIWVSFCEIYNENIHDLLEAPSGAPRRAALRLSQDARGDAFIKDLRWVQVDGAEEAFRVLRLGRRNQSFSSTLLNQLSSRSHSIFSIRILRVTDGEPPRVHAISELCLCDLAGSERSSRTQNKGERLKEAGNINASLLILGKCIKALRHNQHTRLLQHVPFRESKLTHYLQGFFCGRGKACMVVNVSQCASMYDETLNVLKFSAVAQKVEVLISRLLPVVPPASCSRKTLQSSSSSLTGWEASLEDLQQSEDEDSSLMEDSTEETADEGEEVIINKSLHQRQVALLEQLLVQLKKERAKNMLLEARVREEVGQEFTKLFSDMQKDFDERLTREREILEDRAERRLEIYRTLTQKMYPSGSSSDRRTLDGTLASDPAGARKPLEEESKLKAPDDQNQRPKEVGEEEEEDDDRRRILLQLQQKSLQEAQLEELQQNRAPDLQNRSEGDELLEAELHQEKARRAETLAALEYQTAGKEEALASLQAERGAREEATAALEELRLQKEELLVSLEEERKEGEKARAALEAQRRAYQEEKRSREEVQAALEAERKEVSRLVLDGEQRQQQEQLLQEQLRQLSEKLEAQTASLQPAAREVLNQEVQELTREVQRLNQELKEKQEEQEQLRLQLREEISELSRRLAEEEEDKEIKQKQIQELQRELQEVQATEKLNQELKEEQEELRLQLESQGEASRQEAEQLREKLQELEAQLESHHQSSRRGAELLEASQQELQEQKVSWKQELEEQHAVSCKQLEELEQKLREQQEAAGALSKELKEAELHRSATSSEAEALQREKAELLHQVTSLTEELSALGAVKESSSELEQRLKEKEEALAQMERASAQRGAELQEKLQEAERQLAALQRSLQEAKERRDEEEHQAAQEARRREAERRRELLAVAHEALAQKEAELEKRAEEISRLKENAQQEADRAEKLSLELQRKQDDSSDLKEKLADYKKQMQQVQKEISAMRDEEKVLKQKLADADKVKKQLQLDLSSRDRTIQQLRAEQPDSKSDQTLQLYQKACNELEAKQRVMEDMRLALTEQEETQEQMEQVLEEKMGLLQELSAGSLHRELTNAEIRHFYVGSTLPSSREDREHLQVYLRVRPFTSAERSAGESQDCVTIEPPDSVLLKPPSLSLLARLSSDKSLPQAGRRFQFSKVYGPETTQAELFDGAVRDLVQDVLGGGNSLVFTYGVTNSGKTFTFLGPDSDGGVVPRSLRLIFSSLQERLLQGASVRPQRCREFTVLTRQQQAEEALVKKNLLRESENGSSSLLNMTHQTLFEGTATADRVNLEVPPNTKFSIWVSFCEIYNENIHDLLEAPSGAPRRAALRLSQDVRGDAFIKDLRWVQVDGAEEAFRVLRLGRRNQSFSSTRLNQLSSRSHSIFSIRILRVEDGEPPRVHAISELCLCDLAGSERSSRTQNKGERLKEAGNINASLLILGKCIKALRHNQHTRLLQHVPFRESKLTHYLQGFFCGRGKACMVVNVSQCASMYDETLNVLKFSAVAQKVEVVISRLLPVVPPASCSRKTLQSSSSSLTGWEASLEDLQQSEDEDSSLMEDSTEETADEGEEVIINKSLHQRQVALLEQLLVQLKKERAKNMLLEARVREEVGQEFTKLFSDMQKDFDERLTREREILEDRAERRLEIYRTLTQKMYPSGSSSDRWTLDGTLASDPAGARKPLEEESQLKAPDDQNQRPKEVGEEEEEDDDRRRILLQLQQKSLQEAQLEELQQNRAPGLQNRSEGDELLEAELHQEKARRAETLAALEYQTAGREEALASLQAERGAREEATAALEELRLQKEELLVSLEEERKEGEKARAALEAQRRAYQDEKRSREEAQAALEAERKEVSRLVLDGEQRQQQEQLLQEQLRQLSEKLEAQTASLQPAAREVLNQEVQELTREVQRLNQELKEKQEEQEQLRLQLREEISELSRRLAEEEEDKEIKQKQIQELQRELQEVQAAEKLNQELKEEQEELRLQLESQGEASRQEAEQLREKLQELEAQLESQHQTSRRGAELLEASQQELQEQKVSWKQELEEQHAVSCKQLEELEQKLREQQEAAGALSKELKEAELHRSAASSEAEALQREKAELLRQVTSLTEELSALGAVKESSSELEQRLKEKEEALAQMERASAQRGAELQEKLQEAERQLSALQRSLQEAKERRDEEEHQAAQEARRREAERRRELLAVAHEALAQKEAELEKRAEEISRLKENAQQEADRAEKLSLELQRKQDDSSDLKEKLADYKKQMQQVQKEISAMRDEEKVLKQKLADADKVKKQLQLDLSSRDRTIQQLRAEQPDSKSDQTLQLYQKACNELEAKQRVMEDMRLALTEQEETQEQMEQVLEEKMALLQELSAEVNRLKEKVLQQNQGAGGPSEDLDLAKDEASRAQESLKILTEKSQAERRRWQEEKLSLIGQAKEAEDKRNQEMRKFAEDRERYCRQQSLLESKLLEKEAAMESWRKERDALVAALEVQLQKLLSSQAEKDKVIKELSEQSSKQPAEGKDGAVSHRVAELQVALMEKEAQVLQLKEELEATASKGDGAPTRTNQNQSSDPVAEEPSGGTSASNPEPRVTRASLSSRGSSGFPSVLESSEISTEGGRTSRFPRPELEISFSPLQPNRMALRRQGEQNPVTVKISRSARKRKSGEMEKSHIFRRSKRATTPKQEEVGSENRRNTRTKLTPKKAESSSSGCRFDSQSSRKDGTLQKIGDFLQSSPTLLGSKAKKMMSRVSGRLDPDSAAASSSLSLRAKRGRKKLYRPEISCPMDMPPHPMINQETDGEGQSDHDIIKRRLRSRVAKS